MYTKHDVLAISIHASREGSDRHDNDIDDNFTAISIHASREGSDHPGRHGPLFLSYFNPRFPRGKRQRTRALNRWSWYFNPRFLRGKRPSWVFCFSRFPTFQSTLPAREATPRCGCLWLTLRHFNPRFPRGKRPICRSCAWRSTYFNPRFPRGKRLDCIYMVQKWAIFQSTLPAGEAT